MKKATYWAHSEDSDQTGRADAQAVFAGHTCHLLVLSWGGSYANALVVIGAAVLTDNSSKIIAENIYVSRKIDFY